MKTPKLTKQQKRMFRALRIEASNVGLMSCTLLGHPVAVLFASSQCPNTSDVICTPVAVLCDPKFLKQFAAVLCDPNGKPLP